MYEIYALRLGMNNARVRAQNLLEFGGPDAAGSPMPQEFFAWLLIGDGRIVLIDCGLPAAIGRADISVRAQLPAALADIGVTPAEVTHIILSHAHWDHVGFLSDFSSPVVTIQRTELEFLQSSAMRHRHIGKYYDPTIVDIIRSIQSSGRLQLIDGTTEVLPGIRGVLVGGHTLGSQVIAVESARGCIILASDAIPFYDNMTFQSPFPILVSTVASLEGFDTVRRLIHGNLDYLIPGHDPAVSRMFRNCGRTGLGVALHERPSLYLSSGKGPVQ